MSIVEPEKRIQLIVDENTSAIMRAEEALENKEVVSILGMGSPVVNQEDGTIFQEMPMGEIKDIYKETGGVRVKFYRPLSGLIRSGCETSVEVSATRVIFLEDERRNKTLQPKEETISTPEFKKIKERIKEVSNVHIPGISVSIGFLRNDEKGAQVNEVACGFVSEVRERGGVVIHLKRGPQALHGQKVELFPSNLLIVT